MTLEHAAGMRQLARFATRRPDRCCWSWALAFVLALLFASTARNNLHETDLQIPGTDSANAPTKLTGSSSAARSHGDPAQGPADGWWSERGPELVAARWSASTASRS